MSILLALVKLSYRCVITNEHWRKAVLLGVAACLGGCIEVDQRIQVHEDGSIGVKGAIKIDPQYEALVLPQMKREMPKKAPPGVKLDFSQRIDGKAAILLEADGDAANAMLAGKDGSTGFTVTVGDGGFMKKRYEFKQVVTGTPDVPFPYRLTVNLPGSIESVMGGKKTADDTVEFDLTHAKRGNLYAVSSTAFAFALSSGGAPTAATATTGAMGWLMPASAASICVGTAFLLIGWLRARRPARMAGTSRVAEAPAAVVNAPAPAEPVSSVFCTECGAPNTAGRKFCGQCGHALE